ncbi:MAG: FtsL-like putative cell division protein, partial [Bacteroidia bacterium]
HRSDKKVRKIEKLNREVKELYSEYITLQTEILNGSRSSNLEQKMLKEGIKPATSPPIIIKK